MFSLTSSVMPPAEATTTSCRAVSRPPPQPGHLPRSAFVIHCGQAGQYASSLLTVPMTAPTSPVFLPSPSLNPAHTRSAVLAGLYLYHPETLDSLKISPSTSRDCTGAYP